MPTPIRFALAVAAGLALTVASPTPRSADAQCVGADAVESFADNMTGCAGAVTFDQRATMCAPGWQPCSAEQWVLRSVGKAPGYHYWTSDTLRYNSASEGCFVTTETGTQCFVGQPMRVCTFAPGDFDGAYGSATHVYTVASFLDDGGITVVTALDSATLEARTFIGAIGQPSQVPAFSGTRLGGPGALTLTFTSTTGGTDGTSAFTKLAGQTYLPDVTDFILVRDRLGNSCNWHNCGLNEPGANRYFGGCNGNATAGVLCCQ